MRCRTDLGHMTEYDFVQATTASAWPPCVGPSVTHSWTSFRLDIVEQALFHADVFGGDLWDCFDGETRGLFRFTICTAHSLLVSGLLGLHGTARRDHEWVTVGVWIMRHTIDTARWDLKEMQNLYAWRRAVD